MLRERTERDFAEEVGGKPLLSVLLLESLLPGGRARLRFGYRRAWELLRREGPAVNVMRVHRIWRKAGLALSRRRPRKRRRLGQQRQPKPEGVNSAWAWDFVRDVCANGQELKCLTVVDEHSCECLAIDVAGRISARRVIEVLSRLVAVQGPPKYLRSDNGPEFIAKALRRWLRPVASRRPTASRASPGRTAPTRASTAASETSACQRSGARHPLRWLSRTSCGACRGYVFAYVAARLAALRGVTDGETRDARAGIQYSPP